MRDMWLLGKSINVVVVTVTQATSHHPVIDSLPITTHPVVFYSYHKILNDLSSSLMLWCFPRDRLMDTEGDGLSSSPVPSPTERQEDSDNLKNSAMARSTAVSIPVTITAPPGETTIIPSQ